MGAFARVLSVFVSPGAVFADIARKPTVALALILLTLVSVGGQLAVIPHMDMAATIQARMEKSGRKVSDAQMTKAIEMGNKFKYVGVGIGAVATPAMFLLLGLVFWLGVKLLGSDTGYVRILSTVTHAFLPATVVSTILLVIIVSRSGMIPATAISGLVKANLGAFLPSSTGPALRALAGSVDLFAAWSLVLLAMGLATVGRLKQARATALVVGLWLVYVVGHVGLASLGHLFS